MTRQYAAGKKALGMCDRCGQQYLLKTLKNITLNDHETNLLVCKECYEPDHPQNSLGDYVVQDPQTLRRARPDTYIPEGRYIQWGWNPIGFYDPLRVTGVQSRLEAVGSTGTVTVTIG